MLVGFFGCNGEDSGAPAPALSEDEAQQLDALGYLDFASEPEVGARSGVVARDPQRSWAGYDLLTYPVLSRAELIDFEGRVVRSWSGAPGRWERAALTESGDLLVVAAEETDSGRRRALLRFTWEGESVWRQWLPVHHHAEELADGRIAALLSRPRTVTVGSREIGSLAHSLAILSPDGATVLEERPFYEMLAARPDSFQFREGGEAKGHLKRDALHANYFDWMPGGALAERNDLYAASNVVVTLREQDTVAIFDWVRGEMVWAWGQGEVVGPHDARILANGNLLIFDNRSRDHEPVPGEEWSRVIELDPLTREIVWQYRADPPEAFVSGSRGIVQRLPNGNTLIGASNQGRVFEVTPDRDVVFDYLTPHRNESGHLAVLRVNRYPSEFIDALFSRIDASGN
jgi:hypothetical protein